MISKSALLILTVFFSLYGMAPAMAKEAAEKPAKAAPTFGGLDDTATAVAGDAAEANTAIPRIPNVTSIARKTNVPPNIADQERPRSPSAKTGKLDIETSMSHTPCPKPCSENIELIGSKI